MPPIKGRKAKLAEIMAEVGLEDDPSDKHNKHSKATRFDPGDDTASETYMHPGHNKENEQPYNNSLAKKKKDKSSMPPASAGAGDSKEKQQRQQKHQKQQQQQKPPPLLPKPAYPTTCNAEFCILCGCILTEDMYKRYKNLRRLSTIIRRGCVRTPYVYEYIVNMAASKCSGDFFFNPKTGETIEEQRTVPCCVACINWIHRLEKSMKKEFEEGGEGGGAAAVAGPAMFVGICCDEEDGEEGGEEDGGNNSEQDASSFYGMPGSSCEEDEDDYGGEEQEENGDDERKGSREGRGKDSGLRWSGDEISTRGGNAESTGVQEAIEIHESDVIPDIERKSSLVFIPLDNLILFLMDPGGLAQPDKRSIGRLMCALCATNLSCCEKSQQAEKKSDKPPIIMPEVANPYRMFCSPISLLILLLFEERYAHKFRQIRELESEAQRDRRGRERRRLCVEGISSEESTALLNDVVAWQWAAIGMPRVLPHAGAAKAARKALRGGLE